MLSVYVQVFLFIRSTMADFIASMYMRHCGNVVALAFRRLIQFPLCSLIRQNGAIPQFRQTSMCIDRPCATVCVYVRLYAYA